MKLTPSDKLRVKFDLWIGAIFVCILPFVFLGFIPDLGWTYVWVFLAANAVWMVPALVLVPPYCRSIQYELGDREIIVSQGIVTKAIKTVPYRTVTNIEVKRGLFDRWLGIGGIAVHTAGFSTQGGPEIKLEGLDDCEAVHAQILAQLRRFRAKIGPAVGVEEPPVVQEGVPQLLSQILEELRELRRVVGAG